MTSYVTHLEAAIDGTILPAGEVQTLHRDRPLWVRYDLPKLKREFHKEALRERPHTMWRYRELLPIADNQPLVTFGEAVTPLLPCVQLGRELGLNRLVMKDESQL